jgi:hemerythrin superfamily protein
MERIRTIKILSKMLKDTRNANVDYFKSIEKIWADVQANNRAEAKSIFPALKKKAEQCVADGSNLESIDKQYDEILKKIQWQESFANQ